jgi:hypothetical protein
MAGKCEPRDSLQGAGLKVHYVPGVGSCWLSWWRSRSASEPAAIAKIEWPTPQCRGGLTGDRMGANKKITLEHAPRMRLLVYLHYTLGIRVSEERRSTGRSATFT